MIANLDAAHNNEFDLASFDAVIFSGVDNRRRDSRVLRIFASVLVLLAHVGIWWLLQWGSRPDVPRSIDDDALLIDFITRAAPAKKLPETKRQVANAGGAHLTERKTATSITRSTAASAQKSHMPTTAPPPGLYNSDGSVHVPAEVLADLAKLRGDAREFDFQLPGLNRADALMLHRSPLEYRATRFDKDWRPNEDLLTELLNRAVEASTKEIKIPIPGDPRHHLVCKVSLLAMGGGCGVEGNGDPDALLPGHDDPNTLSTEEDRACQAWWEKIIATKTQDEWRQTRKLYDQECRKPLARVEALPAETIKAPSGP